MNTLENIITKGKRALTTTALAGAIALGTVGCGNDNVEMTRSNYEKLTAMAGQRNVPLQDLDTLNIEDSAVMSVSVDGRQMGSSASNGASGNKPGLTDRLYKVVTGVTPQGAISGGIRGSSNKQQRGANPMGAVIISNDGKPLVVNGDYHACDHKNTAASYLPAPQLGIADTPTEIALVESATRDALLGHAYRSMAMEKKAEEIAQQDNAHAAQQAQNAARFRGIMNFARGINYTVQTAGHAHDVHDDRRTFGSAAPSIGHDLERALGGILAGAEHYEIANQEGVAKEVAEKLAADAKKNSAFLEAQANTHLLGYANSMATLSAIDNPLAIKTRENADGFKAFYAPGPKAHNRSTGRAHGTTQRGYGVGSRVFSR